MGELPLFPVTVVGSWPRPDWLLKAMKRGAPDLEALQDKATEEAIQAQLDAGIDILWDGEQRRDSFLSFISEKIDGIRLMTMADLLEYVEDKAAFENLLSALDVPAFAIKNPTVVGPISRRSPLAADDVRFLRTMTDKPVKVPLPGPYLMSRSAWVKALSEESYPTRESMGNAFVQILREEIEELISLGVEYVQFDEPVLTELAFAGKSSTRTFMCAALAASADPEGELDYAVELINRVVEGFDGIRTCLHICRGNWSQDESVLLTGSYDQLIPHLGRMNIDQFVLEYATPRAGSIDALSVLPGDRQLGYGIVNPRTEEIETVETVVERARKAADLLGPERIFLNPDCGFGTFAERPVATAEVARKKLDVLVAAAKELREIYQPTGA
jgi:5-methyltetrahydropteroyltriglutamate--homocysteine methyltransferase